MLEAWIQTAWHDGWSNNGWRQYSKGWRSGDNTFTISQSHKYSWAYINWLQTEQVLILPKFGIEEDSQDFEQISRLMPEYAGRIEMVDASDLVIHGGCFNCCSWTIREEECTEIIKANELEVVDKIVDKYSYFD